MKNTNKDYWHKVFKGSKPVHYYGAFQLLWVAILALIVMFLPQTFRFNTLSLSMSNIWYSFITAVFVHGNWFFYITDMVLMFLVSWCSADALKNVNLNYPFLIAAFIANLLAGVTIKESAESWTVFGSSGGIAGLLGFAIVVLAVRIIYDIYRFCTSKHIGGSLKLGFKWLFRIGIVLIVATSYLGYSGLYNQPELLALHGGGTLIGAICGLVFLVVRKIKGISIYK